MKTKDFDWYKEKVQSIKERKRKLKYVEDPKARKRIKQDLKREQRGAKHAEKHNLKKFIKEEVIKFYEE